MSYLYKMPNILILENINTSAIEVYKNKDYTYIHLKKSLEEEELIYKLNINKIDVLCIRSKTKITRAVIDSVPSLKAIGCYCIGTNQVDLDYCCSRGIPVFNCPYMNTRSVAELTISHIIALSRKIGDKNIEMHNGFWNKSHIGCYEIRGKTLGIIGYGHVGSQVSILAEAMGMNVFYFDILNVLALGNARKCNTLDELLGRSDFVSLHVPLTPLTKELIGETELSKMKCGSYLLNLSRGAVVDVNAVSIALKSGFLAGSSFDVYPKEPKKNSNNFISTLQKCPNTILTPHIGGATEEAQQSIGVDVSNKIINYLTIGDTFNSVNFPQIQIDKLNDVIYIKNIHKNNPGVMSKLNSIFGSFNINIIRQYLDTKKDIGYSVSVVSVDDIENLTSITNMIGTFQSSIRTEIFI